MTNGVNIELQKKNHRAVWKSAVGSYLSENVKYLNHFADSIL